MVDPIMTISFVPPLPEVEAHLKAWAAKLTDFKEPLRQAIKEIVIPSMQTNFQVGGRPAWAPYSEMTIELHKLLKESMSSSLLVKSGALKDAMASESLWTVSSTEAYIAGLPSSVWYGQVHQAGYAGGANNGPIPARPFAMLQPSDEEAIANIFDKWVHTSLLEAWPGTS